MVGDRHPGGGGVVTQFLEISDGRSATRFEQVLDGLTGKSRVSIEGDYATYGPDDLKKVRAFLDDQIERMEDSPWPT